MAIMEHLGIPEYRHRKSNHMFSYRRKIVLLVLRQRPQVETSNYMVKTHNGF